jgi:hypothetical protein
MVRLAQWYGTCAECGEVIAPGDAIETVPSLLEGFSAWVHAEGCGGGLW